MALTDLIPNGSRVKEGDIVATFDPAQQMDAARDALAKFEDLGHQVEQKLAEIRNNTEKRLSDLRQAEAEFAKAKLELQAEIVLSEIDRLKLKATAAGASAHLESLKKSSAAREKSEAAALRILELQRDRQKINMDRAEGNRLKMEIRAPISGMVVHDMTYRAGSLGRALPGDQLNRGYPLLTIFEPTEMQVRCSINEPDILSALSSTQASIQLDAYPGFSVPGHFLYSSPVASAALLTPVKSFLAVFQVDQHDPRLLPDLSASVVISPAPALVGENRGRK
jgi:multidrug resistance efflux pump